VLVVCNFTPVPRYGYKIGAPAGGTWREILNSDAVEYGGSGQGNLGGLAAAGLPWHGHQCSLSLTVPPLALLIFMPEEW
jgi:1,4-alpha-glucan branching enzyme